MFNKYPQINKIQLEKEKVIKKFSDFIILEQY